MKNCALTLLYYVSSRLNGFLTFITLFATDLLECTINSNSQSEVRVNTSLSLVNFPLSIEKTNMAITIISALKKSIQTSRQDLTEQVIQKLSTHLGALFQHNLFIRVKTYFMFMNYFDDLLIKSANDENSKSLFTNSLELLLRSNNQDEIENYSKDVVFR